MKKRNYIIRMVVAGIVTLSFLPVAAYFIATWLFGNASLGGAYLFASLFAAGLLLFGVGNLKLVYGRGTNYSDSDPVLSERASRLADELGTGQVRVFVQPEDHEASTVFIREGRFDLYIVPAAWRKLTEDEQQFALAQEIAQRNEEDFRRVPRIWATRVASLAGCVIATQSYWSIPVMIAFYLLVVVPVGGRAKKRQTTRADLRALLVTEDMDAAQSVMRGMKDLNSVYYSDAEERIAALRLAWQEQES